MNNCSIHAANQPGSKVQQLMSFVYDDWLFVKRKQLALDKAKALI
jgi:hypothetical protein